MRRTNKSLLIAIVCFVAVEARAKEPTLREKARQVLGTLPKELPAPAYNPTTREKVELGKMLYFDPRLSLSQRISCNSCHNLAGSGADLSCFS